MRRKILVVICALLIALLTPFLYYCFYVPYALGKQYISVSFLPAYGGYAFEGCMEVVVSKGNLVNVSFVGIKVNVSNSYFIPVYVRYNGFDFVWLIYNRTVSDPSDVVSNREFLVWGAFYYLTFTSYRGHRVDDFTGNGFEYYASRRELSNFTKTLKAGTYMRNYLLFMSPGTLPGQWYGQYWFNVYSSVPPGTYYMYCIIFGITSGPYNLTITSVFW